MPAPSVMERKSCAPHGCSRTKCLSALLSSHTRRGLSVVLQQGLVPVYGLPLDQISIVEEDCPILLRSTFLISKIWASDGDQPLQFASAIPLLRISSIISYLWWRGRASVMVPKGNSEGVVAPA
jgi:hypothetical protein